VNVLLLNTDPLCVKFVRHNLTDSHRPMVTEHAFKNVQNSFFNMQILCELDVILYSVGENLSTFWRYVHQPTSLQSPTYTKWQVAL